MPDTTQTLATKFTADVKDALDGINKLKESFSSLISASDLFNKEMAESTSAVSSFSSIVSKATAVVQSFQDRLEKTVNESGKLSGAMKTASAGMDSIKDGVSGSAQATNEYSKAVGIINEQFKGNKVAIDNIVKELNKLENNYHALNNQGIDTKRVLDGEYNAINLVSKAYENWGGKAKSAVPMFENVSKANKALTTGLSDTEFKLTDLGKAFFATSSKGQAFFDALVTGGKQFGVHTEATSRYSKALIDVHTHLSNLPQSSANYDAALKELGDSSLLNVKAMELMNGEIARSKDGFIALNDEALVSGTTMNAYGQRLIELESVHKNLRSALENYTKSHKTNDIAVQNAGETLSKYGTAMQTVKSEQKLLADQLAVSGRSFTDLNGNILSTEQATAKLRAEKAQLTNFLQNETNMLKFLDSGYEASREGLMRFAAENLKGSHSVQEFYKELNGLNAGLEKVGQYGTKYADALRETTKETFNNKGAVEEAVKTHLKYAQTAESLIEQHKNVTKSLQDNATQAKATAAGFNNLTDYTKSLGEAHDKFAGHLRDIGTILNLTSSANTANAESMLNNAKAANTGSEAIDRLHESSFKHLKMLPEHADLINRLNSEIDKKNMTTQQAEKELKAETAALEANKQKVLDNKAAQEQLGNTVQKQTGYFQNLITKVKELAVYYAASAILFALTLAFREGVKAIMDFDQSLHSLKAITNATDTEITALGDTMQEVARNSRYTASEVADGMQIMGQAGLDSVQIMNSIKGATDLATGTLEKMDVVVDLLTTTMTVFGKNSLETTEIVDAMAVAINKSKSTVDKMRTAFNYVGVTAGQAGLSLQEASASIMMLNDSGMKGSTSATTFRQVLQRLIAPSQKLQIAYREAGIEIAKVNPLTAGYQKALEALSSVLWDSEKKTVRVGLAMQLFGTRGQQAATALVKAFNSGSGGYKEAIDSLYESGEASRMAAEQMEGLQAKAENLVSRMKELAITIGETGVSSLMGGLIDVARGLIETFRVIITIPLPGFIDSINSGLISFAGAIMTAVVAVTTWNWALNTTLLTITGVGEAFKTFYVILTNLYIANPILLGIAFAVAGLVFSFKNFQSQLEKTTVSLGRESLEAKKISDVFLIFKDNLIKAKDGTVSYEAQLKRFGLEHKNLTAIILEQTGALKLSDIGYEKLIETLDRLQKTNLTESLNKTGASLKALRLEIDFLTVTDKAWQAVSAGHWNNTEEITRKTKEMEDAVKKATKEVFEQSKATKESNETTLAYIDTLNFTKVNLEKIKDGFLSLVEAQRIQNLKIKETGQTMLQGMEDIYQGLTAVQKTEITKMAIQLDEELVQFEKWAKDHDDIVENSEAVRSGIVLKWQMKALDKLSEFSKKAMEIEEEKYAREQSVYDRQLKIIEDYIEDAYLSLRAAEAAKKLLKENASEEEIKKIEESYQNAKAEIEIGEQMLQDKILEIQRATLERKMKVQEEYITALKKAVDDEAVVFDKTENQKLESTEKNARKQLVEHQKLAKGIIDSYGYTSSKFREYLDKELEYRKQIIEAMRKQIDNYLSYVTEKYALETEISQRNMDDRLAALDVQLNREVAILESTVKYETERNKKIYDIQEEYANKKMTLADDEFKNQTALWEERYSGLLSALDKEYAATDKAADKNFSAWLGLNTKVENLNEKAGTSYQGALDNSVGYTKVALSEMSDNWEIILHEQGVSYVKFKDYVYVLNKEMTSKSKEEKGKEVEAEKLKNEEIKKLTEAALVEFQTFLDKRLEQLKTSLSDYVSMETDARNKLKSLTSELLNVETSYHSAMRKNRQLTMTDVQKYYDDMKEVNRLYNLGITTNDRKYFDQAKSLIEGHTDEVKDANGNVVISLKSLSSENASWLTKLFNATKSAIKKDQEEAQKAADVAKEKIAEIQVKIEELQKVKDQFSLKALEIKSDLAIKSLDDLKGKLAELQDQVARFANDTKVKLDITELQTKIGTSKTEIEDLKNFINSQQFILSISIIGKEKKDDFDAMVAAAEKKAEDMKTQFSTLEPEIQALIKANPSESDTDKKSFNDVLDGLITKVQTTATDIAKNPMEATVNVKGFDGESITVTSPTTLLDTIKQKADALVDKAVTYTITVLGLDDLLKAVEKQNELKDTSVTHTINVHTVYTSSGDEGGSSSSSSDGGYATSEGGADIYGLGGIVKGLAKFAAGGFTGQLKGFGGGDIVPALLEPGEFVLRKEAVKKYGTDLFRMFNDMRSSDLMTGLFNKKFSIGGSVFAGLSPTSYQPPQTSSSSKQMDLHVIEFKVDNSSHQLYGEKNTITSLIQNMRRARLVTV